MGRPDAAFSLAVATVFLLGQAVLQTVNSVYMGFDRADVTGLLMGVEAISKAIISLMLVAAGFGIVGALLGAGLGALIASVAGIFLMWRVLPRLSHTFRVGSTLSDRLGPMLSYGFPIYLSTLLTGIIPQYLSLVLARFVTDSEIGNYSTTINFSGIALLVTSPVAVALLPAFSKLSARENKESVQKMFKLSVKYTSLMVVPIAVAFSPKK
jgi:O-antigen/teichoic acid export membrane protein